jgi:hypothetical protein
MKASNLLCKQSLYKVREGKLGDDRNHRHAKNWKAIIASQKHPLKGDQKQREKLSNPDPYLHLLLSPYFPHYLPQST